MANTFKIEPGKKYLVIINIDEMQWTMAQKDELKQNLEALDATIMFLPKLDFVHFGGKDRAWKLLEVR